MEWTSAITPPKEKELCLFAVADILGENWAYMLGIYIKKGSTFKKPNGVVLDIHKSGYITYNEKTEELLMLNNVKYWSKISAPADISKELVICDEEV